MPIVLAGDPVTPKPVAQYGDACNLFRGLAELEHKFAVLKMIW